MEAVLLILGSIGAVALIILYGSFSWGFVLYKFWYWFLLPVFPLVPHITFWQAVGLSLMTSFFKSTMSTTSHLGDEEIKEKTNWAVVIIMPWATLFFAWFIKLFI